MLDAQYRPTDLAFYYDTIPVFSGSAEADTIWQEGAVSGSADGRTWCDDPVGQWQCDQHCIRIDGATLATELAGTPSAELEETLEAQTEQNAIPGGDGVTC